MARFLEAFCTGVDRVAGLLLAVVTIIIFSSTIGRYLFAWPIPDAFDISRLMIGACIMWGFASLGYRGGHINVDVFYETMPERMRHYVDLMAWIVLLFFTVLLCWKMLGRVESAWRSNESTFDLRILVWPFLGVIWLGTVAAIGTIFARIYLIATGRGAFRQEGSDIVAR